MAGLIFYKQQITIPPKTTRTLSAKRGLIYLYTDINHGNAIISIHGQSVPRISEIHNGTQGAIVFDGNGGFLNVTNTSRDTLQIFNNSDVTSCNLYVLSIIY